MSYAMTLDEVEESDLVAELNRRLELRDRGLCDYCGRRPVAPTCKFPKRHYLRWGGVR